MGTAAAKVSETLSRESAAVSTRAIAVASSSPTISSYDQ
jgi:hypothetical protein